MPDVIQMPTFDQQELEERTEEAEQLDETHLVDYAEACWKEAEDANKEIYEMWDTAWDIYNNEMDFSDKEDWQNQVALPKAFSTVQQAKAVIRRSLNSTPNYFSLEPNPGIAADEAAFWEKALRFHNNPQNANFPMAFSDASEMTFVLGLSMEMIPVWKDEGGLEWVLVEPWKVRRDPDAMPRRPFSGNYWIHEEWVDLWRLKQGEQEGLYVGIDRIPDTMGGKAENEEEEARRRQQFRERSKFRKSVRVREFWGVVLDRNGNLLLPNARYTIAGGKFVIRPPAPSPFQTMRWPGVSFTSIPHLLRYEGRGLLEGVIKLWKLINNFFNLSIDDLNWVVNAMLELDPDMLDDEIDYEAYPGKTFLRKTGTHGMGQAVSYIEKKSRVGDTMLPMMQLFEKIWQNSTFVSEFIEGLPGHRSKITRGEVEIKTRQAMGVFDSMMNDLEDGATRALWASLEIISLQWDLYDDPSPLSLFEGDYHPIQIMQFLQASKQMSPMQRKAHMKMGGISSVMRQQEVLQRLQFLTELSLIPEWKPYIQMYNLLSTIVDKLELGDLKVIISPEEAKIIEQMAMALPAPGMGMPQ